MTVSAPLTKDWSRGPFRVEFQCGLEFTGPLHVGTGEALSLTTDAPVLRTADGTVWLPASSVRGVLADWCQREAPLLGVDQVYVRRLLGVTPGRGAGTQAADRQGRLTVLDVDLHEIKSTQIRDHVKIKREWGAAETGAKFDHEIAHPRNGTLRLIYDGDGLDDPELVLLRSAVAALQEGLLAFGGKTGWGLGSVQIGGTADDAAIWKAVDRAEAERLSAYLTSKLPNGSDDGEDITREMAKPPSYCAPRAREDDEPTAWSWLRIDLKLVFDGPMLVAALDTTAPDDQSAFARERREADAAWQTGPDRKPVLAGSALRGPLRSDAERIAKTLALNDLAKILFGNEGRQGLIRVGDGWVVGEEKHVLLNHVSIDRVTGFAATNRLFDAAALASPSFRSRLLVHWNHAIERHRQAVALLLFVLRDSAERGLWIGSRTTRGCGYVDAVDIEEANWSLVEGGSDTPCSRVTHCRGTVTIPELGRDLGFVDRAWKSAFAARESVRTP